jgi:hypothetical protein
MRKERRERQTLNEKVRRTVRKEGSAGKGTDGREQKGRVGENRVKDRRHEWAMYIYIYIYIYSKAKVGDVCVCVSMPPLVFHKLYVIKENVCGAVVDDEEEDWRGSYR